MALSLVAHLALALLATRQFLADSIAPELPRPPTELLAADFEVLAEAESTPSSPAQPELPARAPRSATPNSLAHRPTQATPARAGTAMSTAEPEPVAVSNAPESKSLHFTITVARATSHASAQVTSSTSNAPGSELSNAPVSSASVDTPARLRAGNVPAYTARALAAGIEANVPLEIVVSESGNVTSARALEHVGYGLDEVARQSVLGYRFTPALRNGKAVPVRMRWLMRFQLR